MTGMNDIIKRLANDFNNYSELVALNYEHVREGKADEGTLQWNRGHLCRIEDYLTELAMEMGVKLEWSCGPHTFGYDDWKRELEYRTVRIAHN